MPLNTAPITVAAPLSMWDCGSVRERLSSTCRTAGRDLTLTRPNRCHLVSALWRCWRGGSGEVSRWNNGPERVAFSDSRINKMPRDSRSVLDKRILARTSGRCRGARRADHVDERAQRSRDLSPPGIIEEQSLERRRPVFEHAYQLPGTLERLGHSFDCIRNP